MTQTLAQRPRILIAEDEAITGIALKDYLTRLGYEVSDIVSSGEDAIKSAAYDPPDLILMDITLYGDMNGIEAAKRIGRSSDVPVIFLTARTDTATLEQLKIINPMGYIVKPPDKASLHYNIELALYRHKMDKERARLEQKLREREEQYRNIFEQAGDAIVIIDPRTADFLAFNDQAFAGLGYSREEFSKLNLSDLDAVESPEETLHHARKVIMNGADWFETKKKTKTGELRDYEIRAKSIFIDGKQLIQSVWRDITERKRAEEFILTQSEVAKNMTEGAYIVGLDDLTIRYANQKFEQMFGYGAGEMEGKHVSIVNAPTDKSAAQRAGEIMDVIYKTGEWHGEVQNIRKDGSVFWSYANVSMFNHPTCGPVLLSVHTDITEQKRIAEKLKLNEEKYRLLIENLNSAFALYKIVLNADGIPVDYIFIEVNRHYEIMTGLTKEQLIGKPATEVMPGIADSAFDWIGCYGKVALSGEDISFEHFCEPRGRWYSILAYCPKPGHVAAILGDITVRKTMEKNIISSNKVLGRRVAERTNDLNVTIDKLKKEIKRRKEITKDLERSESRYRHILESITSYIYTVSIEDGQPVDTVHGMACVTVTGYTADEYDADPLLWHRMIHPDDRDAVMGHVNKALSGERISALEHRIIHKNGTTRWIRNTLVSKYDREGRLVSYDGIINDITERKNAEETLIRNKIFLNTVINSIGDGISVLDTGLNIMFTNAAMERWYPQLIRGAAKIQKCYAVYHGRSEKCEACPAIIAIEEKTPDMKIKYFTDNDGTEGCVEVYAFPLFNESGRILGVVEYVRNISERRRLEMEIAEISAQERLNIGHQLHDGIGQILTGIAFMSKAMEQTYSESDPALCKDLRRIKESINDVISRVRDISRCLSPYEIGVNGLAGALNQLAAKTESIYNVKCRLDAFVKSQIENRMVAEQLYYIASEAITNAVKNGKAENIAVILKSSEKHISLTVEDDGIGFAQNTEYTKGLGIRIMKYRAGIIGAGFYIGPANGKTAVVCSVNP
ncbi:MAG: PAS domain S-box protein [Nitrospirae bacterium]|nr:MAG: PAS domain S-box protein [Nitrospirota bacterium]